MIYLIWWWKILQKLCNCYWINLWRLLGNIVSLWDTRCRFNCIIWSLSRDLLGNWIELNRKTSGNIASIFLSILITIAYKIFLKYLKIIITIISNKFLFRSYSNRYYPVYNQNKITTFVQVKQYKGKL